jgi:hypothetical protein
MDFASHGLVYLRPPAQINTSTTCEQYTFLAGPLSIERRLKICHPVSGDILMVLNADDHEQGGLHHGFILSACAIIAQNNEGFLSSSRDIGDRIIAHIDEVIPVGQYYFFVLNSRKYS